jgi:hypothetical protein
MREESMRKHTSVSPVFPAALAAGLVASFLASVPARAAEPAAASKKPVRTVSQLQFESWARPDGKDCVYAIKGWAYAFIPGKRPQKLFGYEGFNVRRAVPTPEKDGFFLATRELLFYTDPKTGEVIDSFQNPVTGKTNEVFQIQNDPVNSRVRVRDGKYISVSIDGKREYGEAPPPAETADFLVFVGDYFPFYPLPGWAKDYTASELFDFYVPKASLYDSEPPKVVNSWTRVGPWLPWMEMDGHEGLLVYHGRSERFESFDQLPERVRKLTKEKYPKYLTAPAAVDPAVPNETSWTFYNREMAKRKAATK